MTFANKNQKLPLVALLVIALLRGPELAFANCTWTGAASGSWTTAANWSGDAIPGSKDNITIPSGLARYPVVGAAGAVCSQIGFSGTKMPAPSLTIANGGILTAGGNLTMSPGASIAIHAGGTFILNADCNNVKVGLLSMDGGTFVFNGNNLFIPTSLTGGTVDIIHSNPHVGITNFYNLIYSGGTPSFKLAGNTTVTGNLKIASGSQIALNGYSVRANTLTTAVTTETAGTYNQNNASAYILGTTTKVTVSAGPAAQLAFATQPANAMEGQAISGVLVQIQDKSGNKIVSDNVMVLISLNTGAFASGNTATNTSTGSAAFNNLLVNTPGTYKVTASASGLTSVTSDAFTVAALELRSTRAAANGHNQLIMSWSTISGKTYQIQCTTNFLVSNWTPVGNPVVGSGLTMTVTNEINGVPQCFFRLYMQ